MNERLDVFLEEMKNTFRHCSVCDSVDSVSFTKESKNNTGKFLVIDLKGECIECRHQFTIQVKEPKE